MSTEDDLELRDLLVQTLEKNGTLAKLRAQLRASVFLALEEQEKVKNKSPLLNEAVQKLAANEHGRFCMDLIAEFFKCLKMDCSETVFLPESGLNHPRSRENLASDLSISLTDISPSDRSQPLLYILLHKLKKPSTNEHDFSAQGDFHSREKMPNNGVTSIDLGEKFKPATEVDDDFFNEMPPPPPPSQSVLNSVTHRQKFSSSKQSSDSDGLFGPDSSFQAKTGSRSGPAEHSPAVAGAAAFGSNNSSSFLGDLPELPKKTPINPPPIQSTTTVNTTEEKKTGNNSNNQQRNLDFKKLLGESFDEISQQSAESDNSSKSSSKSVSEKKKPADFGQQQKNGSSQPKNSDTNQKFSSKYLFNPRNDSSKNGQHSVDDDVSEEIVEDLEIDDLLNSARSPHQISF